MRAVLLPAFCLALLPAVAAQAPGILHIRAVVVDQAQSLPVARHVLLISDNPATAPPRRVTTGLDGTIDVRLPAGNYTVESDLPAEVAGAAYSWTRIVDVPPGGEVSLELTRENADVTAVSPTTDATAAPAAPDPLLLLPRWRESVVALWSPTMRASGFLVDSRGLIATGQRMVSRTGTVEVQLSPGVKVEGRVLVSDASRDVSIVWIARASASSLSPLSLPCSEPAPPIVEGQEIVALGLPLRGKVELASGSVFRDGPGTLASDIRLGPGGAGGPAFTEQGNVIGLISGDQQSGGRGEVGMIPVAQACAALAAAEQKLSDVAPPSATRLPTEPERAFPPAAVQAAIDRKGGNLTPYRISSDDFEIAFITPLMIAAARQPDRHTTSADMRAPQLDAMRLPKWTDFGSWSEYVETLPPVLLVRVTPRLAEGFWTTIARGAAMTQGVSLPSLKRFKAVFAGLRAFCGGTEVTPIHPLVLELQVVQNETVVEGLYAFDATALGPDCKDVKVSVSSEKNPTSSETKVVDPAIVKRLWQDFEPQRTQ